LINEECGSRRIPFSGQGLPQLLFPNSFCTSPTKEVRETFSSVREDSRGHEKRKAGNRVVESTLDSPRSILIVDDCTDTTDSLALLMRAWGFDVDVANQGPAALQLAGARCPDVVLLDLGMPGMDGYEVARQLRCLPGVQNALLIAISGYGGKARECASREAGFDLHLTKPADPRHLRHLLNLSLKERTTMSPDQLTRLIDSLDRAADVVEAIDNPEVQRQQGWDLSSWRYELIPFGVRFTFLTSDRLPVQVTVGLPDGPPHRRHLPWHLAPGDEGRRATMR